MRMSVEKFEGIRMLFLSAKMKYNSSPPTLSAIDPKPVSSLLAHAVTCGMARLRPRSDGGSLDFFVSFFIKKKRK